MLVSVLARRQSPAARHGARRYAVDPKAVSGQSAKVEIRTHDVPKVAKAITSRLRNLVPY